MTRRFLAGLVIASISGMIVTGCGRKGDLEPPASLLMENEKGQMVEKPRPDRPFILDPLIGHSKSGQTL